MKLLVVGNGGREHALVWKLAQSPRVEKIYCAAGNAGIGQIAELVPIQPMEMDKLVKFAQENAIDFTVIGMDDPLAAGIVDAFQAAGLRVFGPRKNAAIIESSKAFSKGLMKKIWHSHRPLRNLYQRRGGQKLCKTAGFAHCVKSRRPCFGKRRFDLQHPGRSPGRFGRIDGR